MAAVAAGVAWTPLCSRHSPAPLLPEASRTHTPTRSAAARRRRRFLVTSRGTGEAQGLRLLGFGSKAREQDLGFGTAQGGALVLKKGPFPLPFIARRRQCPRTVFVAGAAGRIGARICQRLLREGFNVRAGVSELFLAQQLAEFAAQYGLISREESNRLNAVEFDFNSVESIATAIGNAAKVVVTIGPTEDGPDSKVSIDDASRVVEAAKAANAAQIVLVYETKTGDSANDLLSSISSFFRSFILRGESGFTSLVNQILETDLKYTILKASSTEETLPSTHNLSLVEEETLTETGKVSKAQISTVVAGALLDASISENKVAKIITSPSASLKSVDELLRAIPTDARREVLAEARAKAEKEEQERLARQRAEAEARTARDEANKATQLAAQLDAEAKMVAAEEVKAAARAEKAKARAEAAAAAVDSLRGKLKELGSTDLVRKTFGGQPLGFSAGALSLFRKAEDAPEAAVNKRKANAAVPSLTKRSSPAKPTPAAAPVSTTKPEIRNIFGGIFKQETVYVDED